MAALSRTSAENLQIQAQLDRQAARKQAIGRVVPYLGLVFLFVFFTIVTGGLFISPKNLSNMVEQCFTMCIIATGAAFVYAQGNMDFSIGSACGVAQMCGAILLLHKGWPMPLAMLVTILIPVVTCCVVSTIAVVFHVPVFIGSMCVRSLLAGLLTIGVAKQEIVVPVSNWPIMTNGVFKAIVQVAVIAIGVYLFHFTRIGKWAKAIGGISCVSISQNFTTAFFKAVIDKVTTRAIKALMMLEDQYGCLDNLGIVVESKRVASENNAIINNNIFNNDSSSVNLTGSAEKGRFGSKVTWKIVAPILTAVAGGLLTAWIMNHLPLG